MTAMPVPEHERLVKSEDRVRDLAEVFTPSAIVQDMLDMLPSEMWLVHPSVTFLEPSCGDGNFLVAVFRRKLDSISHAYATGALPAGSDTRAALFHALEALASIYGVDISHDNVVGGTPGHEVGARGRLIQEFQRWYESMFGERLSEQGLGHRAVRWIAEQNILVGNMLEHLPDGESSGRGELAIKIYDWDPTSLSVRVHETTIGAVISEAQSETTGLMSLFGPPEPTFLWQGKAFRLHEATDGLEGSAVGRGSY